LARSPKSRIAVDLLNVVYCEIQYDDKRLPIPDYAQDMHTQEGKKMKRGIDHFYQEGAKLVNETLQNPHTEKAWAMLKKHGGLKSAFQKGKSVK
jgi:replication-associated recombination protein RarA